MNILGKYLVISLLLLSIVYSSCEKEIEIQEGIVVHNETKRLLMEFKHYGCFGTCPVYDIQVMSDGKVSYNGTLFTEFIGRIDGYISQEALLDVYEAIEADSLIPLDTAHHDTGIDLPLTKFSFYQTTNDVYEELYCMGTCQQYYNVRLLIIEELLLKYVIWNQ